MDQWECFNSKFHGLYTILITSHNTKILFPSKFKTWIFFLQYLFQLQYDITIHFFGRSFLWIYLVNLVLAMEDRTANNPMLWSLQVLFPAPLESERPAQSQNRALPADKPSDFSDGNLWAFLHAFHFEEDTRTGTFVKLQINQALGPFVNSYGYQSTTGRPVFQVYINAARGKWMIRPSQTEIEKLKIL